MRIDVWSDVICPWCYIGKRNLEAAIGEYRQIHGTDVEVVWRSFELDPTAPTDRTSDLADTLAKKYGTDRAGAIAGMDRVAAVATQVGLHYRFDLAQRCNTFDAHRLIHQGLEVGGAERQGIVKERLFAAYFTEGANLSDHETLQRLAVEAGLDADEARETLASDRFAAEVRADEAAAREIGVTGVPFFMVPTVGVGVSGAQPPERLLQMLDRATT